MRAARPAPPGDDATRRRLLAVLIVAQVLSGLGGAAAAATALLALEMTGREALASLPLAVLVVASAAIVGPVSALSRRSGRRVGLSAALALATAGSVAVVAAAAASSFALLLVGIAAFGGGNTAVMLARYAAADLSAPAHRGRAMGAVVFATTFGAVAGPNLLAPAGRVATAVGLPPLTGIFVLAAAAFAVAALLLLARLRPDPLHVAATLGQAERPREPTGRPPLREHLSGPGATAGLAVVVVANFVMVAVMAMAPVHMRAEGHDLDVIGIVVSVHIAGMFAPALLTGSLTDRLGPVPVAAGGTALLVVAAVLSATAGHHGAAFAVGLGLLGVGWNAALIAGSTLLASAVPLAQRPRAEAVGEVGMGVTAGAATAIAGPIVGFAGYATLAALAAAAAATLAPLIVHVVRRGGPVAAAPANRILS